MAIIGFEVLLFVLAIAIHLNLVSPGASSEAARATDLGARFVSANGVAGR